MNTAWPLMLLITSLGCRVNSEALSLALNKAWTVDTYPNPYTQPSACGRGAAGIAHSWICDPDGVITAESAGVVEGVLKLISEGDEPYVRAPCADLEPQGYQVAVALMKEFKLAPGASAADAAQSFARQLHSTWGVGRAECGNGVLLLLSTLNRQIYISTGKSAAVRLTNELLDEIINNAKAHLRSKEYGAGVEQTVLGLGRALAGLPPSGKDDSGDGRAMLFVFCAVVAAMFGWSWWNTRQQRARFRSCQIKLEKLKRDQQLARAGRAYECSSCPICLEDLQQPFSPADAVPSAPPLPSCTAVDVEQPLLGPPGGQPCCAGGAASEQQPAPASAGAHGAKLVPVVLLCGHAFCEPCISTWLAGHVTCPICRRPVDQEDGLEEDAAALAAAAPPGAAAGEDEAAAAWSGARGLSGGDVLFAAVMRLQRRALPRRRLLGRDMGNAELAFRVHSLRRQYPWLMSAQAADQMANDVAQGVDLSVALQSAQQLDPFNRAVVGAVGEHGASTSFGGGGADGGGGRGGGW